LTPHYGHHFTSPDLGGVGGCATDHDLQQARAPDNALVAGQPCKLIAFELGVSVRTVEVHRTRMFRRLGIRKLGEAVRLAVLAEPATR